MEWLRDRSISWDYYAELGKFSFDLLLENIVPAIFVIMLTIIALILSFVVFRLIKLFVLPRIYYFIHRQPYLMKDKDDDKPRS